MMKRMTMKDRWEIHDQLEKISVLITSKISDLESEEDIKELILYQIEIDKILYKLVY